MNTIHSLVLALCPVVSPAHALQAPPGPSAPRDLRVEYLTNPIGLDEPKPRLSWIVDDARRGAVQSAYELAVGEDRAALEQDQRLTWTSGKVASDATNQIEYGGPRLESGHTYWWKVRSHDAAGQVSPWSASASWSVGPLAPTDWTARWIRHAEPQPVDVPAHDGWFSGWQPNADDLVWVQIDLGVQTNMTDVRLYPAHPADGSAGHLFPLKYKVWMADEPTFMVKMPLHLIDETFREAPNPGDKPVHHKLSSTFKLRYLRFGFVLNSKVEGRGHGVALSEIEVLNGATVISRGVRATCSHSVEQGGWGLANLFDGRTESSPAHPAPPPAGTRLRREFELAQPIARATLHASALGVYQLRLNGQRVGERVLAPEWTHYGLRSLYQSYDVTALLQQGANALAADLGDGWYAGRLGVVDDYAGMPRRGLYGRETMLLAQLDVELQDGSRVRIASDDQWRSTLAGPLRENDLLDGSTWDARRETPGWDRAGFAGQAWQPVTVAASLGRPLVAQRSHPMRVARELAPVSIRTVAPGVHVADFGSYVSGWCRLTAAGQAGDTLVLRHAEGLTPDGALDSANLANLPQTDRFVLAGGGRETCEPLFTLHGFRYVEISGLATAPAADDLRALDVQTAARTTAEFACSEPVLEGLWRNTLATQRAHLAGNTLADFSRAGRVGGLGEFGAGAQAAMYSLDLAPLLARWANDVRDVVSSDGRLADIAPNPLDPARWYTSTPGACDAAVTVPWSAWVHYGDRRLLKNQHEFLRRHIDLILNFSRSGRWEYLRGLDLGDVGNCSTIPSPKWNARSTDLGREVFATAQLWQTTDTFVRIRKLLGEKLDPGAGYQGNPSGYPALADSVRTAFQKKWVNFEGRIDGTSQAGYALALATGAVDPALRPLVARHLKEALQATDGQLTTGIHTTHHALIELAREGFPSDEYLAQTAFPALGWQLERGATRLWARRDAYRPDSPLLRADSSSLSGLGFTGIGEYLCGWIGGLRPDPEHPGWREFLVAPAPTARVTQARVAYDSIVGRIEAAWKKGAAGFELELLVPANTRARVLLPAAAGAQLTEAGRPLAEAGPYVQLVEHTGGHALLRVQAGRYTLRASN